MKKLLGILILGLLWINPSFAEENINAKENISGFSKIRKSNMVGKVDRIKAVKKSDGYPVYEGKTSIQVTVNRMDAGCSEGNYQGKDAPYCDGKYNRSRQELKFNDMNLKNKEHIYEWAMYLDENYKSLKYYSNVVIGQMHTADTKKCWTNSTHFWLYDRKMDGDNHYIFGSRAGTHDPIKIAKIEELKGKWTHIKLHVLFKSDKTGRYLIYKDNELIADVKDIKTLADKCTKGYLKLGIYRFDHIGYFNNDDFENLPDQTIYFDNITKRKPKKEESLKNK